MCRAGLGESWGLRRRVGGGRKEERAQAEARAGERLGPAAPGEPASSEELRSGPAVLGGGGQNWAKGSAGRRGGLRALARPGGGK